jgi:heat shock protein HtpX
MTIYTRAESNIRKTWFLITGFLIFIIGLGWIFSRVFQNPGILFFAVIFSLLMNIFSFWYSDKIILKLSRAQEIKHQENPEIYHIVENLCIAAGLPLPKIYLIPEGQINAFATGRDKNHAVIALTKGALEKLEKSELEGVISHELSHVGNKDMLLMTLVVVLVGFISIASDWFLRSMWWGGLRRRSDNESGQTGSILALVGIILAVLSPFIALLIQLAISRKREFLADSSGALLTRFPEGLARALEKIASDKTPLKVASNATAHLYIANPFKSKKLTNLFLTHPPIEERIKALREMEI